MRLKQGRPVVRRTIMCQAVSNSWFASTVDRKRESLCVMPVGGQRTLVGPSPCFTSLSRRNFSIGPQSVT